MVSFVTGHGVREVAVWRGTTKMIENMQKLIEDEAMAYFRADVCLGSPESFSLDEKREICEQMESTSDGRGCMMSAREPANLDDARAQAAERLLERKRLGLESAIEALEAVGYRVVEREDGSYAVRPPYVRTAPPDDADCGKAVTQSADFLANYPIMLTAQHVAEITGLHVNRVRSMFNRQALPAVKLDNNRWYLPKQKFLELFDAKSGIVG